MKYTTEIEIHAPIEKVALLLGDHEQMSRWFKELKRYELISGKPRHEGAKTRLMIDIGSEMEVTETILKAEFPYRITAEYTMEHGNLIADNLLQASTPSLTRYSLNHYFKFNGVLKVGAALMKPAFIRHSEGMMKNFKELVEGSVSG